LQREWQKGRVDSGVKNLAGTPVAAMGNGDANGVVPEPENGDGLQGIEPAGWWDSWLAKDNAIFTLSWALYRIVVSHQSNQLVGLCRFQGRFRTRRAKLCRLRSD
jgi:hypothetical protein